MSTLVSLSLLLTACATSPTGRHQLLLVSEESAIVSSREAHLTTVIELDNAGKLEHNWVTNKRGDVITGRLKTETLRMRPTAVSQHPPVARQPPAGTGAA